MDGGSKRRECVKEEVNETKTVGLERERDIVFISDSV